MDANQFSDNFQKKFSEADVNMKISKEPRSIKLSSPPKKLFTEMDQLDWKIPPCISNWKNAKWYTIPLEMRLSAYDLIRSEKKIELFLCYIL
jgi:hypothetical protein